MFSIITGGNYSLEGRKRSEFSDKHHSSIFHPCGDCSIQQFQPSWELQCGTFIANNWSGYAPVCCYWQCHAEHLRQSRCGFELWFKNKSVPFPVCKDVTWSGWILWSEGLFRKADGAHLPVCKGMWCVQLLLQLLWAAGQCPAQAKGLWKMNVNFWNPSKGEWPLYNTDFSLNGLLEAKDEPPVGC